MRVNTKNRGTVRLDDSPECEWSMILDIEPDPVYYKLVKSLAKGSVTIQFRQNRRRKTITIDNLKPQNALSVIVMEARKWAILSR